MGIGAGGQLRGVADRVAIGIGARIGKRGIEAVLDFHRVLHAVAVGIRVGVDDLDAVEAGVEAVVPRDQLAIRPRSGRGRRALGKQGEALAAPRKVPIPDEVARLEGGGRGDLAEAREGRVGVRAKIAGACRIALAGQGCFGTGIDVAGVNDQVVSWVEDTC